MLEPQCLPPVETSVDNHCTYLFAGGVSREQLSQDETMMPIHIGNVFRQLDPSSSKIRTTNIEVEDHSPEVVLL